MQLISDRIEKNIERIPFSGCWIWTKSTGSHGYGQLMLKDKKPRLAHRLAYESYVGPIPAGLHVLHRCDVRACCNPSHLFVGTHKDNMQDCKKKGRSSAPPIGSNKKISKEQAAIAVAEYRNGKKAKEIASSLGLHTSRIYQLARKDNAAAHHDSH